MALDCRLFKNGMGHLHYIALGQAAKADAPWENGPATNVKLKP